MDYAKEFFEIVGLKMRLWSMSKEEIQKTKRIVRGKKLMLKLNIDRGKGGKDAKELLREYEQLYRILRRVKV